MLHSAMLKRIYIEISNICNVQCSFCPVVERDKQIMSIEEFEDIIKQAAPLCDEVCLHLMGEPLAHPHFRQIIELCKKYKTKVQLTTNGLLIRKYKELIASTDIIRQINFSLQAYVDNFPHKPVEDYIGSLIDFVYHANTVRPELYINFRLWNQQSEFEDNSSILDYIERSLDIRINRNIQVEAIKSKRIWNRLYLHFDSRFEWPSLDLPIQGDSGRCHGVINHVGIHANGKVVPCCLDKEAIIELGNVKNEKLFDILNNERTSKMRDGFKNNKLVEELCQKCTYINRFKK
jgi:radical SAM protein with 4Fe4S-binding SPASM domain